MDSATPSFVHYLPIGTTFISAVFVAALLRRYYLKRSGPHLLWWAAGMFAYGLGTLAESLITLTGNSVALTKAWYILGAILGGYPLAQGSVYLHYSRARAHLLSAITVPFILFASVCVILSPVAIESLHPVRPSGAILEWQWVRALTPFINLYAVVFLIGTAALSAYRFARKRGTSHRALGNALIAFGAILPGIGGTMAKAGMVEGLYVGEFIGVILIWLGYRSCTSQPARELASVSPTLRVSEPERAKEVVNI